MLSDWLFHSVIYLISAQRYMLPAFVGLLLFCVAGLQWLAGQLHPRIPRARITVAVVALSLFLVTGFHIPKKPRRGFSEAADVMLDNGVAARTARPWCAPTQSARGLSFPRSRRGNCRREPSCSVRANFWPTHHGLGRTTRRGTMTPTPSWRPSIVHGSNSSPWTTSTKSRPSSDAHASARRSRAIGRWSAKSCLGIPTPAHSTVRLYRRQTPLAPGPPTLRARPRGIRWD